MWTEQHLSFGGRCMYKRERAGFVFQISLGIVERAHLQMHVFQQAQGCALFFSSTEEGSGAKRQVYS